MAVGALLVALGGLGAAALFSATTSQTQTVVMVHDVRRGREISPSDLAVIQVPRGLTVDKVGAEELGDFVGRTALSDLPAGSFPVARLVGEAPIPDGAALVGVKLPQGRIPSAVLPVGSKVRAVSLANPDTLIDAVVATEPVEAYDGSSVLLDLHVPQEQANTVATLAASDQLVLIATADS